MYGIILILVLVISGGLIAVIGDRLGSKIGKKRFSIFGWRPRDTATFITISTGVLITSVTFLLLSLASDNVRTALFGMEQLNQTMQATEERLRLASDDLAAARLAQERMDQALKEADADVKTLQGEAESLRSGNDALRSENAKLIANNQELIAFNDDLVAQNAVLTESSQKLTADNADLERQTNMLRQGLATLREGSIAFQSGEVIASGVIRAGGTEQDVMTALSSLAQLANRNVSARLGRSSSDQEIWIYSPEYDAAVEHIKTSQTDMIVRIVAAGNLLRGEAIRTKLELYPNSIIYRKDEFIISDVYRMAGGSEKAAEETVMDFLQRVNKAAAARGILPDPIRGSVGVMEGDQFYGVVQALTPIEGRIRLSAYAQSDTDAAGPLRLNLALEKE
ncbi:DUF3084 domain-containing protein [Selenomonas sp. TAMA-11512]|uniref:DUF3084 domain-containing protein n=1 Tax=Selenomonas sp. TAMA-11512 TaxID=3095337 RepID=UPI00308BDC20|nr:DUF3084 domain-containing protein [Selenomonas sp. TAMA-11512]